MSAKRFFYILCGGLGLIILAGGVGYYFASINLSNGTAKLSQRLADERLADQKLSQLSDLEKQYQRVEPLLSRIADALPAEKKQSQIAVQLRNIAQQSGMSLDGLSFPPSGTPGPTSQTVKVGDVLAIPVTFQLTGSYEQLQRFLQLQESMERYTSVTSLSIKQQNRNLTFDIALNVFMKP